MPHTPLQQKDGMGLDLTTPPTSLDSSEGKLKYVTERTYATPSRAEDSDDERISEKYTQTSDIFQFGIRKLDHMLKSITRDDTTGSPSSLPCDTSVPSDRMGSEASNSSSKPSKTHMEINASTVDLGFSKGSKSEHGPPATVSQQGPHQDKRNHHTLQGSVLFKTVLRDGDGVEVESIFSAIARRSKTGVSHNTSRNSDQEKHQIRTAAAPQIKTEAAFEIKTEAAPKIKTEASGLVATSKASQKIPHACMKYWTLLEQILSFEITARLARNYDRCVATQGKGSAMNQCSTPRKLVAEAVKAAVDAFRECVDRSGYINLPRYIERLVRTVMCPLHQTVALRSSTANPRMKQLRELIDTLPLLSKNIVTVFANWLQAISNTNIPISLLKAKLKEPSPSRLSKSAPYHRKKTERPSIAEALEEKVNEPLTEKDKKDGFVYMFWDQQTFGMVKIGRTGDLEKRLKQWDAQCKIPHRYHRSSQDGKHLTIHHCQRIERLMHIELREYRKKRACGGCGKTHIEWFDISAEKAKKVYQKWQDWIMQKPYAQNDAGSWVVRPDMLHTVSQVCTPVLFPETTIKRTRPRKSLPKSPARKRTSRAAR
ncbi:DUF1766-domain-containing protein [Didymella exigua CBS 183.55]|uniref:DUF1766-domain-containing protein n=1 Tax=Didymella exigua CBS 183.55 TaxID=1150837 RepID=A0A6A5RGN2_9PLEO|nr:DUF1766-domain-containing protein [Didymella exigua CBS 183.55]KAF1925656.1 DUF1766-domain-containing protein [Didymella exigua CBS 183.55]